MTNQCNELKNILVSPTYYGTYKNGQIVRTSSFKLFRMRARDFLKSYKIFFVALTLSCMYLIQKKLYRCAVVSISKHIPYN